MYSVSMYSDNQSRQGPSCHHLTAPHIPMYWLMSPGWHLPFSSYEYDSITVGVAFGPKSTIRFRFGPSRKKGLGTPGLKLPKLFKTRDHLEKPAATTISMLMFQPMAT